MKVTDQQDQMIQSVAQLLQTALGCRIVTVSAYDSEDEKRADAVKELYDRYGLECHVASDFASVRRDVLAVYQRLAKLQTKEQFEAMRREESKALGDGAWSMTDEEYAEHRAWANGDKPPMADGYACSAKTISLSIDTNMVVVDADGYLGQSAKPIVCRASSNVEAPLKWEISDGDGRIFLTGTGREMRIQPIEVLQAMKASASDGPVTVKVSCGSICDMASIMRSQRGRKVDSGDDEAIRRAVNDAIADGIVEGAASLSSKTMVTGEALLRGYSALGDVAAEIAEVAKAHGVSCYLSINIDGKEVEVTANAE